MAEAGSSTKASSPAGIVWRSPGGSALNRCRRYFARSFSSHLIE